MSTGSIESTSFIHQYKHTKGAVVAIVAVLTHPVPLSMHLANTVNALVVYVGIVVLHGPPALVAHSSVVPASQPVADIVPVVDGHILFSYWG
ncbi:MAG: hypothetical protein IPN86_13740 [Saprospiraceae bacterium]|nr:hypothetical protein [Saprospiraceae bacterium]